jgi:LmbE family N-acetylglucosaminyl deacetylase
MHLPTEDRFSVPPMPAVRTAPLAGRVLCFAPHPDDEAAGPGGALCLHRRQGDAVRVVLATDGAAGDPDGHYDARHYAALRRDESRAGMRELGVDDLVFWGFRDSCEITDNDVNMLAGLARQQVEEFGPAVIYLPWEGEGNTDHRAVYCGVVRGLRQIGFAGEVLGYEIWNAMVPDVILDITTVVEDKRRAMRCYPSQLRYVDYLHPVFGLNAHRSLIFNKGRGYGEAYRSVRWPGQP